MWAHIVRNQADLNSEQPQFMGSVYHVLLQLLRLNQSETFLAHLFNALRTFINMFSKMLFVYSSNEVCCLHLRIPVEDVNEFIRVAHYALWSAHI